DARTALTKAQVATVAAWRTRQEPVGVATARTQAVRQARRIIALDQELATNRDQITALVAEHAPALVEMSGVGAVTAARILTVWSHPGRIRSEAAWAQIASTCPIPASSGNTVRHRLMSRTGFFRGSELTHRRVPKRDCAGRSGCETRAEER